MRKEEAKKLRIGDRVVRAHDQAHGTVMEVGYRYSIDTGRYHGPTIFVIYDNPDHYPSRRDPDDMDDISREPVRHL